MSNMQIEVVAAPISTIPTAKGSYQVIELAYKNKSFQDKLEGKKVMSFTNKDVFATLSQAKFGDVFNVTRVKNDKGFWDWTALSTGDNEPMPSAVAAPTSGGYAAPLKAGTVTPKSNYETSEERAARQVMIVRQSSLSTAVALYQHKSFEKSNADPEIIIRMAKEFEAFVLGTNVAVEVQLEANETAASSSFADFSDDIPY